MDEPTKEMLCIAATSSMTLALRAERLLTYAGISSEIVSLLPEESRRGCAYGISYHCDSDRGVRAILRNARLPVSQYLKRGAKP